MSAALIESVATTIRLRPFALGATILHPFSAAEVIRLVGETMTAKRISQRDELLSIFDCVYCGSDEGYPYLDFVGVEDEHDALTIRCLECAEERERQLT